MFICVCRYIGNTDFAKGELIGLEMETWDSEGHDGTRKGKRYFECKAGHGKWTRREKIERYLKVPQGFSHQEIKKLLQQRDAKTGKKIDVVR